MSRPRFLADEDLRGTLVDAVRRMAPTVEIATIVEQGWSSAPDEEVLEVLAMLIQRMLLRRPRWRHVVRAAGHHRA